MDKAVDKSPPSGEQVANKWQTSGEQVRTNGDQVRTNGEQAANNPEPTTNNPEQGQTRPEQGQTRPNEARTRPEQGQFKASLRQEQDRKPSDLLKYARKHAPSDGDERETRCAWIVQDKDAPAGEWWIAKCCGAVLDSSAKVGGHRCRRSLGGATRARARRRAARSAQPSGGARWWPF